MERLSVNKQRLKTNIKDSQHYRTALFLSFKRSLVILLHKQ